MTQSKFSFISKEIKNLEKNNLYRRIREEKVDGPHIIIGRKKLLNLCSNDYLGMPKTNVPIKQMQSSSRLVSGNDESFIKLEKKLSRHKSHESSLIFPTGYMANLGVIGTIANKDDLILSDELNHASIIDACKLSGAKVSVYKHNDMYDLKKKIQDKRKRKFIVTEGIFSMDGDFSKLKEIEEIASSKGAITMLDDAHGDFTVGNDGKGTPNFFKVSKKIDVYISSLSKGLGAFGGYVASQKNLIDYCINKSKSFIYTSALPTFCIEYATKRFDSNRNLYQKKLERNVKHMINGLQELGYDIESKSHIIPIIIGEEKKSLEFGKFLFSKGVFAQPIRYPTVAKTKARIRLSITAWLSKQHIDSALSVFETAGKKFEIT